MYEEKRKHKSFDASNHANYSCCAGAAAEGLDALEPASLNHFHHAFIIKPQIKPSLTMH